jgi:hypothetical protein
MQPVPLVKHPLWCELHASSLVAVVLPAQVILVQAVVSLTPSALVHLSVNPSH